MQGWMSQDGERPAVPAPTCSAGLAQDGGTRPTPPRKPNSPGGGRWQQEGAPRQGLPKLCLAPRLGWTMAPGCSVMGTAQPVPHSSSRHPAGPHSQRRPPGRMGRGSSLGWGGVPGLPRTLRSGRTQDGRRRHPGEAGGAAGCASLPRASGGRNGDARCPPFSPTRRGILAGLSTTVPVRRPRPSPVSGSAPGTGSAGPDGSAGDSSRSRGAGSARLRW